MEDGKMVNFSLTDRELINEVVLQLKKKGVDITKSGENFDYFLRELRDKYGFNENKKILWKFLRFLKETEPIK